MHPQDDVSYKAANRFAPLANVAESGINISDVQVNREGGGLRPPRQERKNKKTANSKSGAPEPGVQGRKSEKKPLVCIRCGTQSGSKVCQKCRKSEKHQGRGETPPAGGYQPRVAPPAPVLPQPQPQPAAPVVAPPPPADPPVVNDALVPVGGAPAVDDPEPEEEIDNSPRAVFFRLARDERARQSLPNEKDVKTANFMDEISFNNMSTKYIYTKFNRGDELDAKVRAFFFYAWFYDWLVYIRKILLHPLCFLFDLLTLIALCAMTWSSTQSGGLPTPILVVLTFAPAIMLFKLLIVIFERLARMRMHFALRDSVVNCDNIDHLTPFLGFHAHVPGVYRSVSRVIPYEIWNYLRQNGEVPNEGFPVGSVANCVYEVPNVRTQLANAILTKTASLSSGTGTPAVVASMLRSYCNNLLVENALGEFARPEITDEDLEPTVLFMAHALQMRTSARNCVTNLTGALTYR